VMQSISRVKLDMLVSLADLADTVYANPRRVSIRLLTPSVNHGADVRCGQNRHAINTMPTMTSRIAIPKPITA